MNQFINDFLEALSSCLQLGIVVPILLAALFGPSIGIIIGILYAVDVL
jgi:hypothetical protein